MYSKIVVGYDDSDQSKDALALGKQIAEATNAELILSRVFILHPMVRGGVGPFDAEEEHELGRAVEAAAGAAGAATHNVESTSPARGLHELAREIGADLLVVGSSRHGKLGRTVLGNVAVALMHGSPCAVAVAPRGYGESGGTGLSAIVVGYDASPESELALESACDLARATGAPLKLASVAQPPPIIYGKSGAASGGWNALKEAIEDETRSSLERARTSVSGDISAQAEMITGDPTEALADAAKAPGSILILGSRGYGAVRRVLLGSVSRALANSAPAPIIVNPRGMHDDPKTNQRVEAGTTA